MKHIRSFLVIAALLVSCAGLAAAQCAGNTGPGGYDLLSTFSGTQDNLSSLGLGTVSFTGTALPGGSAGNADTVVCRITPLPSPIPTNGATLNIQVVALLLQSTGTVIYNNQSVTVYATINQTQNSQGTYAIPLSQLPQPDTLSTASTGTMTVYPNGTFNTNSLNIQADIIVVPSGQPVTSTPIFTAPMPADSISSSGSTWSATAPSGYPNSTTFPSGGFYVSDPSGSGGAALRFIGSPIFRGSLYALGLLLVGIAVMRIISSINSGRLTMKPAYLLVMAAIAWFLGWKSNRIAFPNIVHAGVISKCLPHTISAWVNEGGGVYVIHKIVTAVCTPIANPVQFNDAPKD